MTSRRPGSSPHAAFTRGGQKGTSPTRFATEGADREQARTRRSGSLGHARPECCLRRPRSRRQRAAAGAREGEQEPGRRLPQSRRVAQARKSRACQQHLSEAEVPQQRRVPKGESARAAQPAP